MYIICINLIVYMYVCMAQLHYLSKKGYVNDVCMHACMYVRTYIIDIRMHACTYVRTYIIDIRMHACMYVRTYVRTYVHISLTYV